VYFELADCAVKDFGGKYFALYNTSENVSIIANLSIIAHERYLMMYSERVWAEEEDGVRFMKNRRQQAESTPVDQREFFWIKLKCQTI
jgi:hypothetical protein